MDELIERYAKLLQDINDNRTAGDYTFYGVLAGFAGEVLELAQEKFERKADNQ